MAEIGRLSLTAQREPPRRQLWGKVVFGILVLIVLFVGVICARDAVRWIDEPFPGFLVNRRMVVGLLGQPNWNGIQAGLRYPDKILEASGRKIIANRDLEDAVKDVPIGGPIRYLIERDGNRVEITIPTMRFSVLDFMTTFGVLAFLGFIYLLTGGIVYILKPDQLTSRLFMLACFFEANSSFIDFNMESSHSLPVVAVFLGEVLLPAVVLHLGLLFPEKSRLLEKHPRLAVIPYIVSLALLIPLSVRYPHPSALPFFRLMRLYLFLSVLVFITNVILAYVKKSSVLARQRARVILFGSAIALPVPALAPFVASMGWSIAGVRVLTNISAIPIIIFPITIAYAISKHNLFDVDVFIKRAVGYAIMTAIVGAAYLGLQVGLEAVILTPVFGAAAHKITPVLFAVLVVFLFHPLNRRVQDVVDRMFYRKKFDYKATVTAVSDALSSVLNLEEVVRKIVGTVHSEMFIDRSGLVLAGAQGGGFPGYFLGDSPSGAAEEIRRASLPEDDPIVKLVRERKKLVTKYDVAEDPHFAQVKDVCGRRFEELGASLAVPLLYRDEVKAVLTVGHKKSGHFFTREDVELLQTLASHGAVAIENANLAEQMKKDETVRTNLSRYLSPQIVDRIVKHDVQVNLGGDRKVVTILFSDIRNFTTITETRPPDQLVTILNEYFTEMAKIIFEHQGSLDKYIGDAIVAVFGSLVPVENPAANAVAASVAMMKRLPELNRRWEARYGFYMNIGIGVNTGEVFLGNIGSPERMEFTVIGDAVNVASRFSGLAKAGQVLVTRETRALLGPDVRINEHPPAEVKGKAGKLEVFEIVYTRPDI
jgi:class 3 adenylate cyclase